MRAAKECLKNGLIVADPKIQESKFIELKMAEMMLGEAKSSLRNKNYISAVLVGYISIFRSARALLFDLGFREKSHFCLFEFLMEEINDSEIKKAINQANIIRMLRHKLQYSQIKFSVEIANHVIEVAENLHIMVARKIEKNSQK